MIFTFTVPRVNFRLVNHYPIRDLSKAEEHFRETEELFRETRIFEQKFEFFASDPFKIYPNNLKNNILANFNIMNMNLSSVLHEKH